jgi:hypothetical protein
MILAIVIATMLVCTEWWIFAILALVWFYLVAVGIDQDGVLDRTKYGVGWGGVGILTMILWPTGPLWFVGVGLLVWGWVCLAREPVWD